MTTSRRTTLAWWQVDLGGVVCLAVLTLIAFLAVVRPMAARHAETSAARAQLGVRKQQMARIASSRRLLTDELEAVQAELETSPVRLEPPDHLNTRLADLMELAARSGLQVHETRSGDVIPGEWYGHVPVTISGRGRYPACAGFFNRLHDEVKDVEIRSFELSGQPSDPRTAASFVLELRWYATATVAAAP